jgi:hypothetical protein
MINKQTIVNRFQCSPFLVHAISRLRLRYMKYVLQELHIGILDE